MITKPDEIARWLEEIQPIDQFQNSKDKDAFLELIGNPGFGAFLGLLLGSRQTFYVQLASIRLSTAEAACQASVLQGQIKGIDLARHTVLEQCVPVPEGA